MDSEMNQRLSHLYWMEQWKQIRTQAERIIKFGECNKFETPTEYWDLIDLDIRDYYQKKINYNDCIESVMLSIMSFIPPKLNM